MIAYIYRYFHARPRLIIGMMVGIACYFLLPFLANLFPEDFGMAKAYLGMQSVTQVLIAWVIGAWVYLGSIFYLMGHADDESILQKARAEHEGTALLLAIVLVAAVVSVSAIVLELGASKDAKGALLVFHLALTFGTIITSWLLIHTMFAMHYTHTYYLYKEHHKAETLDFPHDDSPDYWDFLYFSYIIGTSGQTADVEFANKKIRHLGTLHCVLAFFFNAAVLSLMINIASGLMGN